MLKKILYCVYIFASLNIVASQNGKNKENIMPVSSNTQRPNPERAVQRLILAQRIERLVFSLRYMSIQEREIVWARALNHINPFDSVNIYQNRDRDRRRQR